MAGPGFLEGDVESAWFCPILLSSPLSVISSPEASGEMETFFEDVKPEGPQFVAEGGGGVFGDGSDLGVWGSAIS